mgnify:CR=1 FL=1
MRGWIILAAVTFALTIGLWIVLSDKNHDAELIGETPVEETAKDTVICLGVPFIA